MEKNVNTKNRKSLSSRRESGQTIVMMAFLVMGMIAALGLAIDGGRIYFTRRNTQNAVDAALMAATHALCTQRDPITAGMEASAASGLEHNGLDIVVTVNNPPIQFIDTAEDIRYYVDVYVTQTIEPYFIQFVYDGELMVTSSGVAFCVPAFDPMTIPAMYAAGVCDCSDPAGNIGSASISVKISEGEFKSPGGLFFSNGDIDITGSSSEGHETPLIGDIETPCNFDSLGAEFDPDSEFSEGDPLAARGEIPLPYRIDDFMPGGYFAELAAADDEEGNPGIYWALTPATCFDSSDPAYPPQCDYYTYSNPDKKEWKPEGPIEGLYYVEGDVTAGNKTRLYDTVYDVNSEWNGVTIAATGQIDMNVPNESEDDPVTYYVGGFLLFSDFTVEPYACNASNLGIQVRGQSWMVGVLYAPFSGIKYSANDIKIIGAMLAQSIDFSASEVYYEYTPDILDPLPPSVQMAR